MGFNSGFKGLIKIPHFYILWDIWIDDLTQLMKATRNTKLPITMLYAFFWVNPWHLNFICRRFRTLRLFHLHRQVGVEWLNLRIVGVSIREKVWLENSLSQLEGGWRGRGGSGYRAGSEGVMTHRKAAGGYVKEIWLVSGWAMGWQKKTYDIQNTAKVWNQECPLLGLTGSATWTAPHIS